MTPASRIVQPLQRLNALHAARCPYRRNAADKRLKDLAFPDRPLSRCDCVVITRGRVPHDSPDRKPMRRVRRASHKGLSRFTCCCASLRDHGDDVARLRQGVLRQCHDTAVACSSFTGSCGLCAVLRGRVTSNRLPAINRRAAAKSFFIPERPTARDVFVADASGRHAFFPKRSSFWRY